MNLTLRTAATLALMLALAGLDGCRLALDIDSVTFDAPAGSTGGAGLGGSFGAGGGGTGGGGTGGGAAGGAGENVQAGAGGAGESGRAGASGAGVGGLAASGAGGGSGTAAGTAGGGAGGGAGASGSASAGGSAGAELVFPLAGSVVRVEADEKFLTDGVDRIHDWLDLGDYAPAANIGLHAPTGHAPRFIVGSFGDRSVRFAAAEPEDYLRFTYGNQLDDWTSGLTISFLVRFGALFSYQALFDCGTAEDTPDFASLRGRIFIGSDGVTDNLGFHVFSDQGVLTTKLVAEAVINDPDIFKLVTVRQNAQGFASISVGKIVASSGNGSLPPPMARTTCNLGKSLLANKPGNTHFEGHVRAVYAFKRAITDEELAKLDTYVFTRFPLWSK